MIIRILFVLLLVSACAAAPQAGFRDPAAMITSTTRFEAVRFAGPWQMRAGMGALPQAVVFTETDGQITAMQPLGGGAAVDLTQTMPARFAGPDGPIWVLWVDDGYRTAVLGRPDGQFAWVLDRNATGGTDRLAAAREVLDFNGYDLAQLRQVAP